MGAEAAVGVLTLHRCINNGSYWQARCLVDELRARGVDAVVLDHRAPRIDLLELRCALRPTLPTPVPAADRPAYREKVRAFRRAVDALPRSEPFALERAGGFDAYDAVVVGSDEVWNLQHPFYCGQTLFFGHGLEDVRHLAYAASFGSYDAGRGLGEPWASWLRAFSSITVRDENSQRLVATATGAEPPVVADPCLLRAPSPEGPWRGPDEPFVAVYGHNFSDGFATAVRSWASERGLLLVSVGYRNDWADRQWLAAGPHDFAHCMARATAVATNFFHGAVFSLAFERPLAAESSEYRANKLRSLLRLVAAEDRLAPADVAAALDAPLSSATAERVDELRASSSRWLSTALG